jgi:hypothetical protein
VIIQAGASDAGDGCGDADVVFSAANDIGEARAFYSDLMTDEPIWAPPDELKVPPGGLLGCLTSRSVESTRNFRSDPS